MKKFSTTGLSCQKSRNWGASQIVIPLDIAAKLLGQVFLYMVDLFGINRFKILRILFKNPVFWWRCGSSNRIPSYGKDSVPKGPYREVNGYPIKVKAGAQEKHIPDTPNYKTRISKWKK